MWITIIIAVTGLLLVLNGGQLFGLFEAILTFDCAKMHLGNYYSKSLFESNKDRNNDGTISYWERTFPNDGGHRTKLFGLLYMFVGISFMMGIQAETFSLLCEFVGKVLAGIITYSVFPLIWFLTFSAGFLHSYNKYKYPPNDMFMDM